MVYGYKTSNTFKLIFQTRKKQQECKQCLQTFLVKIANSFDQNNTFSCLGVSKGNSTIWYDEKEPADEAKRK